MSEDKSAFEQIKAGLEDAKAYKAGDTSRARPIPVPTEELKPLPCPWCNEEPLAHSDGDDWFVRCMNMDCCVDVNVGPMISREVAVETWNTRSPAWRDDIESAPEHTPVLVWGPGFKQPVMASLDVTWDLVDENGYRLYDAYDCAAFCTPTHWQLPLPPEEGRG